VIATDLDVSGAGLTRPRAEPPSGITRLILGDFRSYPSLDLSVSRRIVALSGENGAGKTNLIEALSLFTPGRGLRRVEQTELVRHGTATFAVSITVADPAIGEHRLGTGLQAGAKMSRLCRIDGASVGSAIAFAEYVRLVWLTPDLDGLFRGPPGDRRRFLDRLVLAVDARHGARVNALDRSLRQRNRLLEEGAGDPAWLDAIEREIAELGIAVAAARGETVARLDAEAAAAGSEASPFPFARLMLAGDLEAMVAERPALDAEDRYRLILRDNRHRDAAAGRTLFGPQASDLIVRHGPKDLPAETCSTGEQKALLLGLVLAHARLVRTMSGIAPTILLDEVAAHLDPRRRAALYDLLEGLGSQVWMTGADPALFAELGERADCFVVTPGAVGRLG
jgi:DNA replication and repair protein RecF